MQKRYIQNLLLATTTKVQAEPDETSSEESEFEYNPQERSIGSLTIAEKTIAGLAANDEDMGSLSKFSCKLKETCAFYSTIFLHLRLMSQ